MEEREQLQREALEELINYSSKLIPTLQFMVEELRGEIKEDTDEILNDVIIGINWEIEVYNQCASLINKTENAIDKREMIQAVKNLGAALTSEDQLQIADCLEGDFLPFLSRLTRAAETIVA